MSKVLIFSDIHLHPHKRSSERLQHCLDALDWAFNTAVEHRIKNILFLGDLFHDRQKIDVLTYQRTFEVFEKYLIRPTGPLFNIHLLLGNHDLWHFTKWDVSSVNPLRSIPGVKIIDKPSTLEIDGHNVSFLPYTHDPVADLAKIENDSENRILCGHIAIDGALWNVMHRTRAEVSIEHDGDMVKVDTSIFKGWDRVFLGHYHAEQKLDFNVEYVGSPLQLSFGEAFQHKHVIVFDLTTNDAEYIRNKFSPQHFIIPEKDLDKYKLDGNFIRVLVDDISSSDLVEMRNDLTHKHKVSTLEIKQTEKEESETLVEDAKAILLKEEEMLDRFVEEVDKKSGLGDLDKKHLLEVGKNVIEGKYDE
jgi:DNA repair exonuclease SbcCD nuclease subunit